MNDLALRLEAAVRTVCPQVLSVSIARIDDRATWSARLPDDASPQDHANARQVIDTFRPDAPTVDDVRAEAMRRKMAAIGAADVTDFDARLRRGEQDATQLMSSRQTSQVAWNAAQRQRAWELADVKILLDAIDAKAATIAALDPIPDDWASNDRWSTVMTLEQTKALLIDRLADAKANRLLYLASASLAEVARNSGLATAASRSLETITNDMSQETVSAIQGAQSLMASQAAIYGQADGPAMARALLAAFDAYTFADASMAGILHNGRQSITAAADHAAAINAFHQTLNQIDQTR